MHEIFKRNCLVQWLIKKGYGKTALKKRREQRKIITVMQKNGKIDKETAVFSGIAGVLFYLPEYKNDVVQKEIVLECDYYEGELLRSINKYIPQKLYNVLDIGANIGSHTLYFHKVLGAEKVYSFEPIGSTFAILKKNIELNKLENGTILENVGVGANRGRAVIRAQEKNNRGMTSLSSDENGEIEIRSIDSYRIEKVSLMKIDTEGFEVEVLQGAKETIQCCRPVIIVEIDTENEDAVNGMMEEWHYHMACKRGNNYIFIST